MPTKEIQRVQPYCIQLHIHSSAKNCLLLLQSDAIGHKALPTGVATQVSVCAESPARVSLLRALQVQRAAFEVPSSVLHGW